VLYRYLFLVTEGKWCGKRKSIHFYYSYFAGAKILQSTGVVSRSAGISVVEGALQALHRPVVVTLK
jgi:hypothetical protein